MVAFGVLFFVYAGSISKLAPAWPAWIPGTPWGYAAGLVLVAAGASLVAWRGARPAALALGAIILLWALLRDVNVIKLLATSLDIATALALGGGAFVMAGTLPKAALPASGPAARAVEWLERLIPLGRFLLAPQMIIAGAEHFIYSKHVFGLVPSWIPWHPFWTYFCGVALMAGGVGLCVARTARLAAALLGTAIFIWVLVLHIPRAFAFNNAEEWSSVFQALAFSGVAFVLAASPRPEPATGARPGPGPA
jgi:uncharacterized membrane protein